MIKPPSIQNEYTLIYSGDPALNLPDEPVEHAHALKVARETGAWPISLGHAATEFHVRPLTGSHIEWLQGEYTRRELTDLELAALSLRLALTKVINFGDVVVRHETHNDGHRLATRDVVNALYAVPEHGTRIVMELGSHLFVRGSDSPSPK